MAADRIRVLVVDDHHLFGGLLTFALGQQEPGLDCMSAVHSVSDALRAIRLAAPHVLVTELKFGQYSNAGLGLIRQVRAEFPGVKTVVLTALDEYYYAALAFAAGADGFVHKSSSLAEVAAVVRTVHTGARVMAGQHPQRMSSGVTVQSGDMTGAAELPQMLTDYEVDLLRRVGSGDQVTQIAAATGLRTEQVSAQLTSAVVKLGTASTTEALRKAIQLGLIT